MMKTLLKKLILTRDEQTLLTASREVLLRSMLSPEQWAILESMERPERFRPDIPITKEDADAWESALRSPVGLKVDTAMVNWLQQQAQRAIGAPSPEVVAGAKFALGCRAGWEMAKTISRLAVAQNSESEEDAPTAAAALDRHQP